MGTSVLQGVVVLPFFVTPVVVIVVHNPNNQQRNLHDSLIEDQIRILNEGFSTTGIQFCLAKKDVYNSSISGIYHIADNNPIYNRFNDSQRIHLSNLNYFDPARYLNIWVVNDKRTISQCKRV